MNNYIVYNKKLLPDGMRKISYKKIFLYMKYDFVINLFGAGITIKIKKENEGFIYVKYDNIRDRILFFGIEDMKHCKK